MDHFENWVVQVRKGLLELCILNALDGEDLYGYELVKRLMAIPGLGVTEGTIYPLLSRLKMQGMIESRLEESQEGPVRKYYFLTDKGRKNISLMNKHLDQLIEGSLSLRRKEK
ncbi:MAG TPA: PadR family transcriptional regulator [bacterium]|nr:PadR family transcriptional regulator [bacterium]